MKTLLASLLLAAATLLPGFAAESAAPLRHVVLFQYKASATPAQVKEVDDAFRALAGKIEVIKGLEAGLNNSPEGLNQGFTHVYVVSFANEADRDVYLKHPKHVEFVGLLKPVLEKACVVDFFPK